MDKIWILLQESNCDGEILINVTPCASLDVAKSKMQDEIYTLTNNGDGHFSGYCDSDYDEMFEVENTDTSFYINDPNDDYYEYLDIIEKEIVK